MRKKPELMTRMLAVAPLVAPVITSPMDGAPVRPEKEIEISGLS